MGALAFILALVQRRDGPLLFLVAPETASAQATPKSHEGCDLSHEFVYSPQLEELEWGSEVTCNAFGMLRITTDAYLFFYEDDDEPATLLSSAHNTCYLSDHCSAIRDYVHPEAGSYRVVYCMSAESIGSTWNYTCLGASESIP